MATAITFRTTDNLISGDQVVTSGRVPFDPGTGHFRTFADAASGNLLVLGEFQDLSSALFFQVRGSSDHPSAVHLHGAPRGENGGIVVHNHSVQNADLGGKFGTDINLTPRLMEFVTSGRTYAFIHTDLNQGGETRGQADTFGTMAGLLGDATGEAIHGTRTSEVIMALDGDDRVMGGSGDDVLSGGVGNDILYGGAGADALSGGHGDDIYIIDDAFDTIYEFDDDEGGIDTVRASITYTLSEQTIENLTLTGTVAIDGTGTAAANVLMGNGGDNVLFGLGGEDMLFGGRGDDDLRGGAGNDRLDGGDGADRVVGGEGADVLFGNSGADTFVYLSASDSTATAAARDSIRDFVHGQDRIDVSAIGATVFVGGAAFSGAAGEVRAVASASGMVVQGDLDGDRIADFGLVVVGNVALEASDFIF